MHGEARVVPVLPFGVCGHYGGIVTFFRILPVDSVSGADSAVSGVAIEGSHNDEDEVSDVDAEMGATAQPSAARHAGAQAAEDNGDE